MGYRTDTSLVLKDLMVLFLCSGFIVLGGPTAVVASEASLGQEYWRDSNETSLPPGERWITPRLSRMLVLSISGFEQGLDRVPLERLGQRQDGVTITLPRPDGSFERFSCLNSPLMEPELAVRYPGIRTFRGQGIDDPAATLRCDCTPAGFHAMILSPRDSWFIDPCLRDNRELYQSYFRRDLQPRSPFTCLVDQETLPQLWTPDSGKLGNAKGTPTGAILRIYRIAIAATGEYTTFHGGTVSQALAAIVTSLNRIVGVYELEVAVRMVLVANNDQIIYTNAATDPYSNLDVFTMLGQNQTTLDAVIGAANYDIGHAFCTYPYGGVANIGAPCRAGIKARGVTGLAAPTGESFDIDYVAHEMGHQFGANHSFNGTTSTCGNGRYAPTAWEPGSASTLMSYAGLCGAEDLQPHSDANFHVGNFDEIVYYTNSGSGSTCGTKPSTGNTPPTVDAGQSYTIPASTPFILTGSASDPDGDSLTGSWEEMDLGAAAPPNTDNGNRPIFRSFRPTASFSRIFPKLSDVLHDVATFGESMAVTTRTMTFRFTARDNRSGGGGVDYDTTTVNVTSAAGPFRITYPTTAVTWQGLENRTVTWNVANTDASPVSSTTVDIWLSLDGGVTFPHLLAAAVLNDGAESIIVPQASTSQGRIKVQGTNNIFCDISKGAITIVPLTDVPTLSPLALLMLVGCCGATLAGCSRKRNR